MANDSSTGGPLVPSSGPPVDDDALDDFFQAWIVGITGLSGTLVFPRYQTPPPNLPAFGTTWLAVGVMPSVETDDFPSVVHTGAVGDTPGFDTLIAHEGLAVLVSAYGPNALQVASLLRDGAKIAQNREVLFNAQMGLVDVTTLTRAPELIKERWLNRYDLTINVRRAVQRQYPVLDIASFEGTQVSELNDLGATFTNALEASA